MTNLKFLETVLKLVVKFLEGIFLSDEAFFEDALENCPIKKRNMTKKEA